jgi:endonuclease/exonuclease/phosphatase family metal-dependent hydrolase
MQDMRRLILGFLLLANLAGAADISVTTWNLKWFPSGVANRRDERAEAKRIEAVARVMRQLGSDIFVFQEVRDEESIKRLIAASGADYRPAIVSRFKDGFGVGWQQIAIIAKRDARLAFAEGWSSRGKIDPPRGFAFALFDWEGQSVAIYGVHLKSNLVRGDPLREAQSNIYKREVSAQQLIEHLGSVEKLVGAKPEQVIVAGDFNTSPDEPSYVSEGTLGYFSEAGFINPILDLPRSERVTLPGEGRYPPVTFDYLLYRGRGEVARIGVLKTYESDHRPVTIRIASAPRPNTSAD